MSKKICIVLIVACVVAVFALAYYGVSQKRAFEIYKKNIVTEYSRLVDGEYHFSVQFPGNYFINSNYVASKAYPDTYKVNEVGVENIGFGQPNEKNIANISIIGTSLSVDEYIAEVNKFSNQIVYQPDGTKKLASGETAVRTRLPDAMGQNDEQLFIKKGDYIFLFDVGPGVDQATIDRYFDSIQFYKK